MIRKNTDEILNVYNWDTFVYSLVFVSQGWLALQSLRVHPCQLDRDFFCDRLKWILQTHSQITLSTTTDEMIMSLHFARLYFFQLPLLVFLIVYNCLLSKLIPQVGSVIMVLLLLVYFPIYYSKLYFACLP